MPGDFKKLNTAEIAQARETARSCPWLPRQEEGVRPACALPYELSVNGALAADCRSFEIRFAAGRELFGERSAGAPFRVCRPSPFRAWDYAVSAGDQLTDQWPLDDFSNGVYHLQVHGPNGFYREFRGTTEDPRLEISPKPDLGNKAQAGDAVLCLVNRDAKSSLVVVVDDLAYGGSQSTVSVAASGAGAAVVNVPIQLQKSHGWYDLRIKVQGVSTYEQRYCGHIEVGAPSFSDPLMG